MRKQRMLKRAGLAASLLPALLLAQGAMAQAAATGAAKPPAKKSAAKKNPAPASVQPAAKDAQPAAAPKAQEGAASLPTVTVVGKTNDYGGADPYSKDYAITHTSTATKTDTPIMETPMAIQVVPRAVMDDQQVVSLKESVQNVSAVQWSPVQGNLYENYVIRGFDSNNSMMRNGVRETAWAAETANIDRVEVLKGTAAGLYGRVEPGGLVNRVTKQPLFTPYYSAQQQFGSFDMFRSTVDATGPINDQLAYRFNVAYQKNQSFRAFENNERIFLAPSLTWRISDRTEVGLNFEYQYDKLRWDDGFPAVGNRPANLPYDRYLSYPNSNDNQEREVVDFHWSHAFNADWKLEQRFVAALANYYQDNTFGWALDTTDNRTLTMGLWNAAQNRNTYSQYLNLTGHADTWGAKHTFLLGFDFFIFNQTTSTPSNTPAIPSMDIYNPDYGKINGVNIQPRPYDSFYANNQTWYGLYFQDQIKLWDKLSLLMGGRADWAEIGSYWGAGSPGEAQTLANQNSLNVSKVTPRFGITYQPLDWLSAYGSYTESLGANNGRDLNNQPLAPQQGQGFEAGFKGQFLDKRVMSSLAYFNILKKNIQAGSPDPILAQQGYANTIGAARNQGIEFDVSGQATENWSVIANYAWINSRIVSDGSQTVWNSDYSDSVFLPRGFVGNRLPLVPRHSANVWVKFDFTDPMFKGLSLGTGVRMGTQTQGDPANDYQIPGYVVWNAMAAYKYKLKDYTMTAQFNAYNMLDHRYFSGSDLADQSYRFNIFPAAPANFMGSLRFEY